MGLYIPKMKMPKNCYDCQIENDVPNCPVYMYYSATEYMEERHPNCPIVEIPEPHGRLADIEDVKKVIFDYNGEDEQKVRTMINALLSSVPTVIDAEDE